GILQPIRFATSAWWSSGGPDSGGYFWASFGGGRRSSPPPPVRYQYPRTGLVAGDPGHRPGTGDRHGFSGGHQLSDSGYRYRIGQPVVFYPRRSEPVSSGSGAGF